QQRSPLRPCSREVPDQLNRDPRILWRARPWRDHDMRWPQRLHFRRRQLVITPHHDLSPQLTHVLHKVVGKRVVVVEDENHNTFALIALLRGTASDAEVTFAGI